MQHSRDIHWVFLWIPIGLSYIGSARQTGQCVRCHIEYSLLKLCSVSSQRDPCPQSHADLGVYDCTLWCRCGAWEASWQRTTVPSTAELRDIQKQLGAPALLQISQQALPVIVAALPVWICLYAGSHCSRSLGMKRSSHAEGSLFWPTSNLFSFSGSPCFSQSDLIYWQPAVAPFSQLARSRLLE